MNSFFRKLTWLPRRRRKEADLEDELRFHLEEEIEERQARGFADTAARAGARRELGNVTLLKEDTRAAWSWTLWDQFTQDVRYAFRSMRQNKAFTALATLSLALGIGANTAIYSFMDAILLRSLPVRDPASLVEPTWRLPKASHRDTVLRSFSGSFGDDPKSGFETGGIFPYPAFEEMQKNSSLFSNLFAYYRARSLAVTIKDQSDIADGVYVTGDYFRGLGVAPAAGRLIVDDDDRAGAAAVAVIGAALARKRFGGAVEAAGASILINGVPVTVIGVAPPEFFGVDPGTAPDFYIPFRAGILLEAASPYGMNAKTFLEPNFYWVRMMARLKPDATLTQAQASLAPMFHNWVAGTATNDKQRAALPALVMKHGGMGLGNLRRRYSEPLYVLMILVGLILAIACANIANLLLARATARKREIAVRLSVGAGRFRVVRQLLTESILLASLGGALGILFAVWGMRVLTTLLANGQDDFTLRAELNWHVLAVAAALSILTGAIFGLAPALQATRVDVLPALKDMRASDRRSRFPVSLSHALIVSQIALSLLMLVAAGLFTRTLSNLQSVEIGFNRENLLLFQMNARPAGHKEPEISTFYEDLRKRFAAIPGARNASLAITSLIGEGHWGSPVVVDGQDTKGTVFVTVGPQYFTTMQIPMLAGRQIEEQDRLGANPVAIVNQVFAKLNFGDVNPLGRHLTFGRTAKMQKEMEIVGVSTNARYGDLTEEIPPTIFVAYNQGSWPVGEMVFCVRTAGDPMAHVNTVRQIVHRADARVPVTRIRTQAAQIDQTINQEIIFARLCTTFALLALLIACVGLYGTMSYHVARRTGEIGIRMALGAPRGTVVWMVLRGVIVLAAVGIAISVPAVLAGSKLVESFLFGMKAKDPLALTVAVATLLCAALLAGYVPARRASRIDPMSALRNE